MRSELTRPLDSRQRYSEKLAEESRSTKKPSVAFLIPMTPVCASCHPTRSPTLGRMLKVHHDRRVSGVALQVLSPRGGRLDAFAGGHTWRLTPGARRRAMVGSQRDCERGRRRSAFSKGAAPHSVSASQTSGTRRLAQSTYQAVQVPECPNGPLATRAAKFLSSSSLEKTKPWTSIRICETRPPAKHPLSS